MMEILEDLRMVAELDSLWEVLSVHEKELKWGTDLVDR